MDCEVVVYTRTEVYGKIPLNTEGSGVFEGIPFRYVKGTPLRESNVLSRQWNDRRDYSRLKKYLAKSLKPGDCVFEYGLDLKSKDIIDIAHSKDAVVINELCEIPFGTGIETSKTISKRTQFEKKILPKVDGIVPISDALMEYAKKHCSPKCRMVKIPILVDFPKYDMPDKSHTAEIPYIFHSGTLFEQKDGFLSMLRAFGKMVGKLPFDVRFISTGNPKGTRHEQEIYDIIKEYGLEDKVVFTGFLTEDQLREYLAKAAFVVINKLTTEQNKYCFSTKLGEYMAASKAILITDVGEAMNWLTNGHDVYIIPPNDVDRLSEAMATLFRDAELRKRLGQNAHETCRKSFSIECNAPKLASFILEIRDNYAK